MARLVNGPGTAELPEIENEGEVMVSRHAGIALMAGVVLVFVASLFLPGNTLISPVDQTDFPEAVAALGDSAILAQWMTYISLIALLLMSFGILGLYPIASRRKGWAAGCCSSASSLPSSNGAFSSSPLG